MKVESQNAQLTRQSKGKSRTKKGLLEHMAQEKQNSSRDLSKNGKHAFTNSAHSEDNLFDDFDDPFEDERDLATTSTPVDKPERTPREASSSPKGVDDQIEFDPFSEIAGTSSSFYKKRDFDDVHSDEDEIQKPRKPQSTTKSNEADRDPRAAFKASTHARNSRRSTMSHFATVNAQKDESGFVIPAKYQEGVRSVANNRRAGWSRRASTSSLNISNHSSHSCKSDATGLASTGIIGMKTPRRAGKRSVLNHASGESTDSGEYAFNRSAHGDKRAGWGRFASMSNLNQPSSSSGMTSGFVVPSTPAPGQKFGAFNNVATSPNKTPGNSRRASMGMVHTPKKPPTLMLRRASVANGLGTETVTPKLKRRASVATGLGNDPSTPMSSMRVRIRQNRKGSVTPGPKTKIDEDTVRRLVKEHLAKERLRKEREKKEKEEMAQTLQDETEGSDSDDDSTNSFEDDASATSYSSQSSCSSRWEEESGQIDEIPRLLKRHDSNDGEAFLPGDLTSANAEAKEQDQEAERKSRKKIKKLKKIKKEKRVKKDRKDKKDKKKSKIKSKSRIKSENVADNDDHSEMDQSSRASSDLLENSEEDDEEISVRKKKDKSRKSRKPKKKEKKSRQENDEKSPEPEEGE